MINMPRLSFESLYRTPPIALFGFGLAITIMMAQIWQMDVLGLRYRPDSPYYILHYIQLFGFTGLILICARCERINALPDEAKLALTVISFLGAAVAAVSRVGETPDINDYIGYGRELAYLNMDPYQPLAQAVWDPVIAKIPPVWNKQPCHYGPTAVLWFAFLNLLGPESLHGMIMTFKAAWFVTYVGFTAAAWRLFRKQELAFTRWLLVCANPSIWDYCLRDVHLEMVQCFLIAASFIAFHRQIWWLLGLILAFMASMKILFLIPLAFFVVAALRKGIGETDFIPGLSRVYQISVPFALYMAVIYWAFKGADLKTFFSFYSAREVYPQWMYWLLKWGLNQPPYSKVISGIAVVSIARALTYLGIILLLAHFTFSRHPQNLPAAIGCALLWLILCLNYYYNWYFFWIFFYLIYGLNTGRSAVLLGLILNLLIFEHERTTLFHTSFIMALIGGTAVGKYIWSHTLQYKSPSTETI